MLHRVCPGLKVSLVNLKNYKKEFFLCRLPARNVHVVFYRYIWYMVSRYIWYILCWYIIYIAYINTVDMKGYPVFDKFSGHPGRTLWYLLVITLSLAAYFINLFWIHWSITTRLVLVSALKWANATETPHKSHVREWGSKQCDSNVSKGAFRPLSCTLWTCILLLLQDF